MTSMLEPEKMAKIYFAALEDSDYKSVEDLMLKMSEIAVGFSNADVIIAASQFSQYVMKKMNEELEIQLMKGEVKQ